MAAATTAQPFWTSKTFWTMIVGLAFNVAKQANVLPDVLTGQNIPELTNGVLLILGMVFRWTADQPLTTNSAATVAPRNLAPVA